MMKSAFKLLSCFVLFALLTGSCEKNYVVSKSQQILFQVEYINYAWSYSHYGFLIDVNGNILKYNLPAKWNFPKDDQTLTATEFHENIASCKDSGTRLTAQDLQKHVNYIDNIAASKVTSPKNVMADAGTLAYYCYQFSESSSTYKRTVIRIEGDYECENLNYYSKKVVAWLNSIRGAVPE